MDGFYATFNCLVLIGVSRSGEIERERCVVCLGSVGLVGRFGCEVLFHVTFQ